MSHDAVSAAKKLHQQPFSPQPPSTPGTPEQSKVVSTASFSNKQTKKHNEKPKVGAVPEKLAAMLRFLIHRILHSQPSTPHEKVIVAEELFELCLRGREQLLLDPPLLDIDSPVFVFGDIHGQLFDLLQMLKMTGRPPDKKLLFLGDYVDRGSHSIETISLLLSYKIQLLYPYKIFLLRGNHETRSVNRQYGFYDECIRKFPTQGVHLWTMYQHVFNCLPLAAKVGRRMFCAHGGISEDLYTFNQFQRVVRPTDICDIGMLCDLIWADPSTSAVKYAPSPRGISQIFGKQAVHDFCSNLGIDVVCRAHQCVMDGYELFADKRCITVFSAPHYCGEIDNAAGILYLNSRMELRILTYHPNKKSLQHPVQPKTH